jgi:Icc-related predicted phosphoesterase
MTPAAGSPEHTGSRGVFLDSVSHMTRGNVERSPANEPGQPRGIRIVAIGDVHMRIDTPPALRDELRAVARDADLVLLTGDMTDNGRLPEVEAVASLTAGLDVPTYAVLGNHDRRSVRRREFRRTLAGGGIELLDGDATVLTLGGARVGLVGVGGYGGGFWPDEAPDLISTRLSQAVAVRARREAARLEAALDGLVEHRLDLTIVNMHYAPTTTTLGHEPMMPHWMLGDSILGRVVDRHRVSLVVHGHAHLGNYRGATPGGTPVRNVALPVIGRPAVIELAPGGRIRDRERDAADALAPGDWQLPR